MKRILAIFLSASVCLALGAGPARASYHRVARWGSEGSGHGQFHQPYGIAVDQTSGDVYVTDAGNDRIEKFTASGHYLAHIGDAGSGAGEFDSPQGLAVGLHEGLFVVDWGNSRVEAFSPAGVFGFATHGYPGGFDSPEDIGIDGHGNFYVGDWGNNRIAEYTKHGGFVRQWTVKNGAGLGVDPAAGRIYVGAANHNNTTAVRVFNTSGQRIDTWPVRNSSGTTACCAYGFAVGKGGDVFVNAGLSIWEFTPGGHFITSFGAASGNGTFAPISGVAVSSGGRVYELNYLAASVSEFRRGN